MTVLGTWPKAVRTGTCEVCFREGVGLYETPIGKFCCADQQTCYATYAQLGQVYRRRR